MLSLEFGEVGEFSMPKRDQRIMRQTVSVSIFIFERTMPTDCLTDRQPTNLNVSDQLPRTHF